MSATAADVEPLESWDPEIRPATPPLAHRRPPAGPVRRAGVRAVREDDVLVVTQKVVSKAEGAIVDLTKVVPRPAAVEFAEAWERDPRQLEVVLREARRIVRMERGVLITETAHGFICANGGVDASNVGPASGSIVTLLPVDPDASAGRIRVAVRGRLGVDIPVIVSDSFGRPWRWGIVDVAIGVSGLAPLEDLRGREDADGRVMRSTVRAVADEIACGRARLARPPAPSPRRGPGSSGRTRSAALPLPVPSCGAPPRSADAADAGFVDAGLFR